MPKGGLEPPRVAPYAPQTYVSTNSTTSALIITSAKANFIISSPVMPPDSLRVPEILPVLCRLPAKQQANPPDWARAMAA